MKTLFTILLLAILTGCTPKKEAPTKIAPAKLETKQNGQAAVVLSEAAEGRLGIVTVRPITSAGESTVPASAVLYEVDGSVWVYARTRPRTYERISIVVRRVEQGVAKLLRSLPEGTEIVTEGAAEIFGTEAGGGK